MQFLGKDKSLTPIASVALEFNQVKLIKATEWKPPHGKPSQPEDRMTLIEDIVSYVESASDKDHQTHMKDILGKLAKPSYREHQGSAYEASISGLQKARKDCRIEMLKIVNEVDEVTKDPTIATQQDRDCGYLDPAIFRKLLPVAEETPKLISNGVTAAASTSQAKFYTSSETLPKDVQKWVNNIKPEQSAGFQMTSFAGDHSNGSSNTPGPLTYMLESVSKTSIISKIEVWVVKNHIAALKVSYRGNRPEPLSIRKPPTDGSPQEFVVPDGQKITSMVISAAKADYQQTKVVYGFKFSTDMLETKYLGHPDQSETDIDHLIVKAPEDGWSLKGFWAQSGDALDRVGGFWGKDEAVITNGVK